MKTYGEACADWRLFLTQDGIAYSICYTNCKICHQNTSKKKNVFLEVAEGIRPNPGGEIICLRLEGSKPGRNGGIQNSISVFLSERAQENFQP